jgi:glycerophosphoryl diester phosphodiesterase
MRYQGSLDWLVKQPIAHRGLHDGNVAVPENSIAAAMAAIDGGFAIECDVHLTEDRVPVIFHDDTLDRMTGTPGRTNETTQEALAQLTLGRTEAVIPTVEEFLEAIGGEVPIVMELKGTSPEADVDFLDRLMPVISGYKGPLALMSFDAWLIDQAIAAGGFPVGLTAEGLRPELLAEHRTVYERGCSFVSYSVHHLPNPFVDWVRQEQKAPVITWTVRTPGEVAETERHADQMTFEGFLPQP